MASLLDSILAKAIDSGLRYVTKKTGLYDPIEENAMKVRLSRGEVTRQEYNEYKLNKRAERLDSQQEVNNINKKQHQSNISDKAKWPAKAKAILADIELSNYEYDFEYMTALYDAAGVLLRSDFFDEGCEVNNKVDRLVSKIDLTKRDDVYIASMYNYAKRLHSQNKPKRGNEAWLFLKLAENNLSACDDDYINTLVDYAEYLLMGNAFHASRVMFEKLSNVGLPRAMFYLMTFFRTHVITGSGADVFRAENYVVLPLYKKGHKANDFLCTYAYACTLLGSRDFNQEMLGKSIFDNAFNSLMQKATEGNKLIQYIIAEAYYNGTGVKQDYAQAIHWYEKAAYQDFALAHYKLGECYYRGNGVTQNRELCLKWFNVASDRGLKAAESNVRDFERFWKDRPKPYGEVFLYDLGD